MHLFLLPLPLFLLVIAIMLLAVIIASVMIQSTLHSIRYYKAEQDAMREAEEKEKENKDSHPNL